MLTEIKWFINQLVECMILEVLKQYVDRDKIVYKSTSRIYDLEVLKQYVLMVIYGNFDAANLEQANLLAHFYDFVKKTKPQDPEQKKLRSDVLDSVGALVKGRELMYNAFRSRIFHRLEKSQDGEGLKILTPNQMPKRFPIALAQVKAGNNSESLLNEIRQIVYSLYRSKEITKKVYNNIINSIKV